MRGRSRGDRIGRINDTTRRSSLRNAFCRFASLKKESLGDRPARGLTSQTHGHVMDLPRRSQGGSWGVKLGRLLERPCTSLGSGLPAGLYLGRRGSNAIALGKESGRSHEGGYNDRRCEPASSRPGLTGERFRYQLQEYNITSSPCPTRAGRESSLRPDPAARALRAAKQTDGSGGPEELTNKSDKLGFCHFEQST